MYVHLFLLYDTGETFMIDATFGWLAILVVGGSVATLVAVLVGIHRATKGAGWLDGDRKRATGSVAALLIAWFVVALVTARLGFYHGTQVPTIELGLLLPLMAGVVLFWKWRLLRDMVDALPQSWIVGVQFFRVEGAVFLVLLAMGRLPGVFAWPAGVGDILVGLLAPVAGAAYMRRPDAMAGRLRAWNLLGILDLVVAVTTGFLSSPSPIQVLALDRPNLLVTAYPLVMIPVFLVPLALLLHLASLKKLRQARLRGEEMLQLRSGQPSRGPRNLAV
jgi:hypothetical protein